MFKRSSTRVQKRIRLAQNFLINRGIAGTLLRKTSITKEDTVLEIGPGEGILTFPLAKGAKYVIAIEKDKQLVEKLRAKIKDEKNITVHQADFLYDRLPADRYKVFSNPPFNITSELVKKLLYAPTPPQDCYLFAQLEAAQRFCSERYEYEFSILTKPWFEYKIIHHFKRTDFYPLPSVEIVLLHIHTREKPLLPKSEQLAFREFVRYGYHQQKKDLLHNFQKIFSYEQWKRLARELKFDLHTDVRFVSVEQWIGLFRFFQAKLAPPRQH